MAKIVWSENAVHVFLEHVEYARIEYGNATAKRWQSERKHIEWRLEHYPTSYPPEALLSNQPKLYRSCHLMHRRFKLIFFYDENADIVYIIDIWDARMRPKALVSRIE